MKKLEAKFQIIFKHWVQSQWNNGSAAFELKRTETDRFYIPNLAKHQNDALTQAYEGSLYHKISDASYEQKPMDCFVLQQALAYVVIGFGRSLTGFYLIPIWVWNEKVKGKTSVTQAEVSRWKDVDYVKIPKKIKHPSL
jgi:hypothetical protein